MTIETKKLVISEELKRKVEMICKFAYVEYSFTNGYIINLKNTNIAYVKPHILKVKGNDYLIFEDEDIIYNHYKFNTPCNVYMYEDEYGIPLKLNHELKTMKEAEDYFKRLEKYVGDYKLNYYISEIDEKENRFNYTQNNDVEKIIRLIGIGDKRKKDDFKLGVITLDLSMFKDKDGKEIYKKLFDKLEKERLT